MIPKHPSEKEIQDYALNKAANQNIAEHIVNCNSCQQAVDIYLKIFSSIEQEQTPGFDFNLTNIVMQQLTENKQPKSSLSSSLGYSTFIIIISAAAILFFTFKFFFSNLSFSITPMISKLLVVTSLVTLVFLFLDIYQNYRNKMNKINLCH